jgi:antitoxin component HigA of HigAB toxin-antitoxin module
LTTKPTINPHSTSPQALLDKRLLAIDAMRLAISALALSAPNARDYQTAAPDAFARAMNEHRRRLARLESVINELKGLAEFTSDQC